VPLPPDEKVISFDRDFDCAMTSSADFAVLVGGTIITLETPPTRMMGAKSFRES